MGNDASKMAEEADPAMVINFPPSMSTQQSVSYTAENFTIRGKDQRKPVNTFEDSDMHSGIVKLKCYFTGKNKRGEEEEKHFWATGQIMNMNLGNNGQVSRCYIQTAAHNLLLIHPRTGKQTHVTNVEAYFHMGNEKDLRNEANQIKVIDWRVYPKYFDNPSDKSGYDFAIISIDISPKRVAVKGLLKFNTIPSLAPKLEKGHAIVISGFPGQISKRREGGCNNPYQPWEMQGSICEIEWKSEPGKDDRDHGLIIYNDIDTSCGQSGSMIYLINPVRPRVGGEVLDSDKKEEEKLVPILIDSAGQYRYPKENTDSIRILSICATNVGVHTGGTGGMDPENWGTLLTPKIMQWAREVITSGKFWKEKAGERYESDFNIGIGSEGIITKISQRKIITKISQRKSALEPNALSITYFEQINEGDTLLVKKSFETRGEPSEMIELGWKLKVLEKKHQASTDYILVDDSQQLLKRSQWLSFRADVKPHLVPNNAYTIVYIYNLKQKHLEEQEKKTREALFKFKINKDFRLLNEHKTTTLAVGDRVIPYSYRESDGAYEVEIVGMQGSWFIPRHQQDYLTRLRKDET